MGYENTGRLGPQSSRREAAREILESVERYAQLFGAGQWHSSAYRLHLDLGVGETAAIAGVLIAVSDDEAGIGSPR